MPTTNPVPSSDPSDLVFNAEKIDQVVNATAPTFTDRLGNVRQTLAGLSAEFPLAQANADAAAASAADALDSETAAASSASDAAAAQVAAEAARDSSFANAKGAATIADARALVADAETFIVYAADALTFDAYRRTSSSTQVFLGAYPSKAFVDAAMLARVQFAVGVGCTFSFTAPNTLGWANLRFFTPTAVLSKEAPRRGPNRAAAPLAVGQCLYIDMALADTTADMVVVEATATAALLGDFTSGKKLLLAYNYTTDNFVGVLMPYLLAAQNKALTATAQTTANTGVSNAATAQTAANTGVANALSARRLIVGEVTSSSISASTLVATVSIGEGRVYKENNAGAHEAVIAPLSGVAVLPNHGIVVDLVGGALDGSGRIIPTVVAVASGLQTGWQSGSKYLLAVNTGRVVHGLYKSSVGPVSAPLYQSSEVVVVQRSDEVDIYIKGSTPSSAKYLRYRMQRKPNTLIISDVWRWNEVWECTRTGEYSFTADLMLAQNGENETAIREASKSTAILGGAAFMGGPAHGNEELFSVSMLIDGVAVALGGTGNFRCRRVEFLQGSDLYEVDTTPARLNRRAKAYKRWEFSAASVVLHQSIVWEAAVTLAQCFLTMLTWLRVNSAVQISDKGYRSLGYQEEDISTTGFTMVFDKASIAKASGPTGRSAEVEIVAGWDKPNRVFNFSNSASYNKFYFEFAGSYTTTIGEVFSSRAIYRIDTTN